MVIVVSLFSVSVFADSSNSVPIPYSSTGVFDSSWLSQGVYNRFGNIYLSSSTTDSFVCYIQASPYVKLLYFSKSPFTLYTYEENTQQYHSYVASSHDDFYIVGPGTSTDGPVTLISSIPVFSSLEDALSSYTEGSSLNYSLPPGNVAFIEVGTSNTFYLNTQFVEITGLFSGMFSKTSQTWGWSDSVVTSGSFPLSGHSLIPWAKGDQTNLLGQSHFGAASSSSLAGSGKYLVIYNPLYSYQNDSENNFEHNFNVNISCTDVRSLTVVSLKGNLASGIESSWTLTSTPDGEVWNGDIDPDTGIPSFTDSQGNSGNPTYGGDNYISDTTQNFRGWLNGIVSSVLGVLESGRNAILTLVSGASSFFAVLPSLYNWLPSPVLSVLTSAMVLVLAIGVIKVFL